MAKSKRAHSTYVMPEPKWAEFKLLTEETDREAALKQCLYFVHYEIPDKAGIAHLKKWMKANWDKSDVDKILSMTDSTFHSVSKYFYCWSRLGWMTETTLNWIERQKAVWLDRASQVVIVDDEDKPTPKVVSIRNNLNAFMTSVDDSLAILLNGNVITNIPGFIDGYKLNASEMQQAVTEIDSLSLEFRVLKEVRKQTERDDMDEQLVEGYSNIKKSILDIIITFFDDVQIGLMETKQAKKITRIRRKKPTDKNKLVRRLKYTKDHPELNLTSINPVEIIGASEVWVYDIKRKRLGVYASEYDNTLGVKGTVIDNYSLNKSYEKTIRKDELIKSFMGCRKNGLHSFMDKISGKKFPAKSRVQSTMVLLKVIT